jgi:hypothetical protein
MILILFISTLILTYILGVYLSILSSRKEKLRLEQDARMKQFSHSLIKLRLIQSLSYTDRLKVNL